MYTTQQTEAILLIQTFVQQYNRLPIYHENLTTPGFPNGAHFRKSFGTLTRAIQAAGYTTDPKQSPPETFTCGQCEKEFTLAGNKLSRHKSEFKRHKHNHHFCSASCAARFTNIARGPRSTATKTKIKQSLQGRGTMLKTPSPGPRCKIYLCTCAHCGNRFVSRLRYKYCSTHAHLYNSNNRNKYAFTFSFADHPTIFPNISDLIDRYGMWSYDNTNGITRDHRISVNEAIRHNYDPYYIKHPINCEVMSWTDNNRKKTKCSITYDQLITAVNTYDMAVQVGIEPT